MLTKEENELFTGVGPGTPCGELMRRYWHPIAPEAKLRENPVQSVRILCEDLVLFRDRAGMLGLIGQRCPHRAVDLRFGIPEETGLRCPYHGWLFDATGQCIEQPLEPPDSTFKEKIGIISYPVEELGGLIWAYLGPKPVPLLPRWDLLVRPDAFREIVGHRLPCNWLQVMENRGDPGHTTYLHGRLFQYTLERQGRLTDDPRARYNSTMRQEAERLRKGVYSRYMAFPNEFGFGKATLPSDADPSTFRQSGGNSVIFPYTLWSGGGGIRRYHQIGVPIDDTTTWHSMYSAFVFPPEVGAPQQEHVPYVEVPLTDEQGEYILDYVLAQDMVAWYAQGEITDRTKEHLGASDRLIIEYRKLLRQQIACVMDGGEPIGILRDPGRNTRIFNGLEDPEAPSSDDYAHRNWQFYRTNYHKVSKGGWRYIEDDVERYLTDKELLVQLFEKTEQVFQKTSAGSQ